MASLISPAAYRGPLTDDDPENFPVDGDDEMMASTLHDTNGEDEPRYNISKWSANGVARWDVGMGAGHTGRMPVLGSELLQRKK